MKYQITVSIAKESTAGTSDQQYVQIKGTEGSTEELLCSADFNVNDGDVTCTVESTDEIGHYECVGWRTSGTDEWSFTKVFICYYSWSFYYHCLSS